MIESKRVSVVVQGPVCGTEKDPAVYTRKCCESVRCFFPEAEIIISTWEDQDISQLTYDKYVKSHAPELYKIYWDDMSIHYFSINHFLISSINGLKLASREYVIKMRSDMAFMNGKCMEYIGRYSNYDNENLEWKIFKQRVITLPSLNPHRAKVFFPYSICDWIQIGLREDILKLYDVPLVDISTIPLREGYRYKISEDFLGVEQYLFYSLLKKNGLPVYLKSRTSTDKNIILQTEKAIAMNLVLMSARNMGVKSFKYSNRMYAIEPWMSLGYYTFKEWKMLYNQYGGGSERIIGKIMEDLIYSAMFSLRIRGKGKSLEKSNYD